MKKPNRTWLTGLVAASIFCLAWAGCSTTQNCIEWHNTSGRPIRVLHLEGIRPPAECGCLSTHEKIGSLYGATINYNYPVTVASTFTIFWTTEDAGPTNTMTFSREKLNIPRQMFGGKLFFCLTENGKWNIKYSRNQ